MLLSLKHPQVHTETALSGHKEELRFDIRKSVLALKIDQHKAG